MKRPPPNDDHCAGSGDSPAGAGALPASGHRQGAAQRPPVTISPQDPWLHGRRAHELLDAWSHRANESIALSIRSPFCPLHCLFCDRDILAAQSSEAIEDYVCGLLDEILLLAGRIGNARDIVQLHLGGGTATEWRASQLTRLVDTLRRAWRLPAEAEMSVDCDPRRVGWARLRLLRGLGFDEVRYGVPDLDPTVQLAIGKLHSAALIEDVCELTRDAGIGCVTLRLMIGLPHQTTARWHATVSRLIAIAPDRITLSRYRHRPWQAPAQGTMDADALPDPVACENLWALAARLLCEAGYRWVGVDQFVLDTDPLAHAVDQHRLRRTLIGHTGLAAASVLGLGVGAHSEVDAHRLVNEDTVARWRAAIRAGQLPLARVRTANLHASRRRAAVEHLLCALELPHALVAGGLEDLYDGLSRWAHTGEVEVRHDRIAVNDRGRHRLLDLCGDYDESAWAAAGLSDGGWRR